MTTLKHTAKPVSEVPFPAVTICGSGFHMTNVEKQVAEDFSEWRRENHRLGIDTVQADTEEYMRTIFQIKPKEEGEPVNIMDILDTMVASNVEVGAKI